METSEIVAKNIKKFRESQNITQKALAEAIGVKHNTVAGYEKRTNKLDIDKLVRICEVLKIKVSQITEEDFDGEEHNIAKQYRLLSKEGKENVNAILEIEYNRVCKHKFSQEIG